MIQFLYKAKFKKLFLELSYQEKELVILADEEIRDYYVTGKASYGLRIKRLYSDKVEGEVFEARVSSSLRILWTKQKNEIIFALLGTHNDLQRFLKNL